MSNLVERLRRSAQERRMCHEAADEIERLHDIERILRDELDRDHAEIERLRAALREVQDIIDAFPLPSQRLVNAVTIIEATLRQSDAQSGQDRSQQPE